MSFLSKLFRPHTPTRAYHYYDVDTFYETYSGGFSVEGPTSVVFDRWSEAMMRGEQKLLVYDDEMDEILRLRDNRSAFEHRLREAARLNNEGSALEKAGDTDGAVAKYEENILPDTFFTLHPYRRLSVIYRRRKQYEDEIRVLNACLDRPEWETHQYASSTERAKFEGRLAKAIQSLTE